MLHYMYMYMCIYKHRNIYDTDKHMHMQYVFTTPKS